MRYPLFFSTLFASLLILNPSAQASSCYGDYTPPVAICDAHTVVALGADGVATVYAYNLDDGSYDNCAVDHFKAARMWPGWCPYGVVDDTQFRPYVQFCCEDVGAGPIWIIVRVFDAHGNYNDCMVEVTVQNGPSDLHCPYDKTIYCDYWFDWNDLYDPWNTFFGWPTTGGGCNDPNVSVEVHDHRNSCGIGHIKRIFSTGGGGYGGGYGYGNSCIQYIWVVDYHPFNGYINWPDHYTADGCHMYDIHPDHLPYGYGYPTWSDDNCSLIGYNYEDQVFEFVEGVCKKILRTWTIIDWCQFDPHHPYYGGIWTYLQVIKLVDHSKPQFENCYDVIVNGEEQDCKGRFKHHPVVWDECTPFDKLTFDYKIDIYANGSYDIIKHGHKYIDEILPSGKHKVLWFVDDNCGNTNSCWFYVTVVDKKPPTPICFAHLSTVVMPIGGMVTIWARDFDASSFDNCTKANQLKFSFSPNVYEASRTFTCDDVGLVPLQVYVTDLGGNQAYCNTFITITDNGPICPEMNPLTGDVQMFTAEAVSGAEVALYKIMPTGEELLDMMRESAADGTYKVGFGTTQYNRMLDVTKESEPLAGITTLDMVYLQQHILGIAPLTHPAALRAADIDGSGRAGVNDLLKLRDAFLSGGRTLNGTPMPWEFYPSDCEWLPNGEPACDFKTFVDRNNPPAEPIDFIGYKLGDINGDIMQDPSQRSARSFPITVKYDESAQAYLFIAGEDIEILGMQLSLGMNSSVSKSPFTAGELNITDYNCYVDSEKRVVNMSWTSPSSQAISRGQGLFSLSLPEYQALQGTQFSWNKGAYRNEVYLTDRTAIPVEISALDSEQNVDIEGFATNGQIQELENTVTQRSSIYSAFAGEEPFFAPNPMVDAGLLYFRSDRSQEVNFEVFTSDQKLVVSREILGLRGLNEITISSQDLALVGVFVYRLTVGDKTYTGKIIRVD